MGYSNTLDYESLAYAKVRDLQRERCNNLFVNHAKRLNAGPHMRSGLGGTIDRALIRAGHAASKRQARRAASRGGDVSMKRLPQ